MFALFFKKKVQIYPCFKSSTRDKALTTRTVVMNAVFEPRVKEFRLLGRIGRIVLRIESHFKNMKGEISSSEQYFKNQKGESPRWNPKAPSLWAGSPYRSIKCRVKLIVTRLTRPLYG